MKQWSAAEARLTAKVALKRDTDAARDRYLTALADIDARERRGRDVQRAEALKRYERAFALRQSGKTFKEIGADLGVSVTRASQMVSKHKLRLQRDAEIQIKLQAGAVLRESVLADFEKRSKGKGPAEVAQMAKELISSVIGYTS